MPAGIYICTILTPLNGFSRPGSNQDNSEDAKHCENYFTNIVM